MPTPRGRLGAWRSAPALEPNEGEQDERYDERTDRVLAVDVNGARLEFAVGLLPPRPFNSEKSHASKSGGRVQNKGGRMGPP